MSSHKLFQSLLRSLLTYLDQVYLKDVLNIRLAFWPEKLLFLSLFYSEFAYLLVNDGIFGNPQIAERLRTAVTDWLNGERRKGWASYSSELFFIYF